MADAESCYQEIHGSAQVGQLGALVGHDGTLQCH